jgi:transcription elongation GreA/GreB family factor
MNKEALLKMIVDEMQTKLDAALSEVKSAKEAATHEESKPENKYDTRGLEATYIAQAQAGRAGQLKEDIYNLTKVNLKTKNEQVGVGNLVKVHYHSQNKEIIFFILPCGGTSVQFEGALVKSISVTSPVGKLLNRKFAEDSFKFRSEEVEILQIL